MAVLTFQLDYHTAWGQQVCICGSTPELGNFNESDALVLSTDGSKWFADINISESKEISYYYLICQGSSVVRREWSQSKFIVKSKQFIIQDLWKSKPITHILHLFLATQYSVTLKTHYLQILYTIGTAQCNLSICKQRSSALRQWRLR